MRRAVLVGCGDFKDPAFDQLAFSLTDLRRMEALLSDRDLCHFDEVIALRNAGFLEVRRAIEKATRIESAHGDAILFYYSGHGKLDRDGTLSLLMSDSEAEYLTTTSLQSEDLKRLFNLSHATQKVMILDCCYSGAVGSRQIRGSPIDAIETIANASGVFVLTASSKLAPAFEVPELEGGALTALIERGIRTGEAAPGGSRQITLNEIASYVRKHVPRYGQEPKVWDIGGAGEMIFAWRPRVFDDAWARATNRAVTAMANDEDLDDDTYEAMRHAIRHRADPVHAPKLELIDSLVRKDIALSGFVRDWDRLDNQVDCTPPPDVGPLGSEAATETQGSAPKHQHIAPMPETQAVGTSWVTWQLTGPTRRAFSWIGIVVAGVGLLISILSYRSNLDVAGSGDRSASSSGVVPSDRIAAPILPVAPPDLTWLYGDWGIEPHKCPSKITIGRHANGLRLLFQGDRERVRRIENSTDLNRFVQTERERFDRSGNSVRVFENGSLQYTLSRCGG